MKQKTWYVIALLLPIVLPFLCSLLGIFLVFLGFKPSSILWVGIFQLFAFPQYILFCVGVWLWLRHKSVEQIKQMSWFLPLLFVPICGAGIGIWVYFTDKSSPPFFETISNYTFIAAPIAILYGYFYVIFAHTLMWAVKKFGWVVD